MDFKISIDVESWQIFVDAIAGRSRWSPLLEDGSPNPIDKDTLSIEFLNRIVSNAVGTAIKQKQIKEFLSSQPASSTVKVVRDDIIQK